MNITKKEILSHHDFQNKIKLFDPDCIEIGLIVNVAPGAPGSGERRKEICLIHSIFKGQFWKMTSYVMNGRIFQLLCCLFWAWANLALAFCLPDESANHYVQGQILKQPLEILLSEFLISLDFCTEGYFTKFCLIEKIILFQLICSCFHSTLGTTIMCIRMSHWRHTIVDGTEF